MEIRDAEGAIIWEDKMTVEGSLLRELVYLLFYAVGFQGDRGSPC